MLSKIRRKLTIIYTVIFGLFLLGLTGIVCTDLIWSTYVERTEEIKSMASEIARNQREVIGQHYNKINFTPQETAVEDDYDISGQVFYYILDKNDHIIKADLPVPILRDTVRTQIMNWDQTKDTKIATVTLPTGETATLALAKYKIYRGEGLVATIYAGRDVTAYARVLLRSILTLTGSAFLFLILAAVIGYYLAGKVTIPIEQSIKRQKQFVADASHELRNPLSVLLTSIEAIEMDNDSVLSPFATQIMSDAKDEFFRLKRLVNDLLTLARADKEDIQVRKENFLLELIADQVIRSLRTVAEQQQISLRLDFADSVELNADPERIHQLLYILIDNGLKYGLPNSEVVVHLEQTQAGTVRYAKIVVEDTGPGIPLDLQQQIFQPFFRVDEARSRDIEGAGLGLSIAQWIVDAHQGKICVNSEPGKGSQFIVLIPND